MLDSDSRKITPDFLDWCFSAIAHVDPTTREYLRVALEADIPEPKEEVPSQLGELSSQIQKLIVEVAAPEVNPLSKNNRNRTLQLITDFRCRVLAVTLVAFLVADNEDSKDTKIERLLALQAKIKSAALTFHGPNIVSATVNRSLFVIMPTIESIAEEQVMLDLLATAEDSGAPGLTCVIDLSAEQDLSPRLLATLMSQRNQLKSRGGTIRLCWLNEQSVPAQLFRSVQNSFGMRKVGGHWFSES
jgi:hypothetical protein